MFCLSVWCASYLLVRVGQKATYYPHILHHTKYLVLYVRIDVISTSNKKTKHSRFNLVPLDVLSDLDNFEAYSKVMPG